MLTSEKPQSTTPHVSAHTRTRPVSTACTKGQCHLSFPRCPPAHLQPYGCGPGQGSAPLCSGSDLPPLIPRWAEQKVLLPSTHTQTTGPANFSGWQLLRPLQVTVPTVSPAQVAGRAAPLRPLAGLRAGPPGPLHSIGPAAGTGTRPTFPSTPSARPHCPSALSDLWMEAGLAVVLNTLPPGQTLCLHCTWRDPTRPHR